MLLDAFLPEFDVRSHHTIRVAAPPEHVYACIRIANFDYWGVARGLYVARTVPTLLSSPMKTWLRFRKERHRQHFTLEYLLGNGFALLGEETGRELVLGTVGCFWRARAQLCATNSDRFVTPAPAGMAKAAWNFIVRPHPSGGTELRTETRVLCSDAVSRWRFRTYWTVVRPFSGLIRREMLAAIRRQAEATRGPVSDI